MTQYLTAYNVTYKTFTENETFEFPTQTRTFWVFTEKKAEAEATLKDSFNERTYLQNFETEIYHKLVNCEKLTSYKLQEDDYYNMFTYNDEDYINKIKKGLVKVVIR